MHLFTVNSPLKAQHICISLPSIVLSVCPVKPTECYETVLSDLGGEKKTLLPGGFMMQLPHAVYVC
jgi:hypothetical protein